MAPRADSQPGALADNPAPDPEDGVGAPGAGPSASVTKTKAPRRTPRGRAPWWVALIWLGPALALIFGVVIYPAIELVRASTGEYSITGLRRGSAGTENYTNVLSHPALGTVLLNTLIWVAAVVLITVVLSLGHKLLVDREICGVRPDPRALAHLVSTAWEASP